MSYTVMPDSQVDVDSVGDETLFSKIRNNIIALRMQPFAFSTSAVTTTQTSMTTVASFSIYIPSFPTETGATRQIILELDAKNSSTSYVTSYRIQDNATSTNGTTVTTSSSSYIALSSVLSVASTWTGTTRTINVQAMSNNASGTASLQSQNRITGQLWY